MLLEETFLKREGEVDERKMMMTRNTMVLKLGLSHTWLGGKNGGTQLFMSSEGNKD